MPDLGPGTMKSDGPFVLNTTALYAIQRYVAGTHQFDFLLDAGSHPFSQQSAELQAFRTRYPDVVAVLTSVRDRCTFWRSTTLRDAVSCASDIVHYNEKVPVYYGALTALLPKVGQVPPDPDATVQFDAILASLSAAAKQYADHAAAVIKAMATFDKGCRADLDAVSKLLTVHSTPLIDPLKELMAGIARDQADFAAAVREYDHDVIVASTTPAYSIIPLVGAIASAVVAGVYGKKAEAALARAIAIQASIAALRQEEQIQAMLPQLLTTVYARLDPLTPDIQTVMSTLDGIRGQWSTIHGDLESIRSMLANDIGSSIPFFRRHLIQYAIRAWAALAADAAGYLSNAFIRLELPADAAHSTSQLTATVRRITAQAASFSPAILAAAKASPDVDEIAADAAA